MAVAFDDLPPQFQEPKPPEQFLYDELPAEMPEPAAEIPPGEPSPPRAPEPFLRRG